MTTNTRTRLTLNTINELTIQPYIIAIPNYSSFFYTFHTVEPIDLGLIEEDCIECAECIQTSFVLLTSDYFPIHPISTYLTNIKKYIDMYIHLMKGIQLLDDAKIIHLNICLDNIIIKDGNLPLLKGFEHAIINNGPSESLFATPHWSFKSPLECRTIRHMLDHKLSSLSKQNIEEISDDPDEIAFLTPYINKPKQTIVDSLLKWANTWNMYSLNHLFLDLLDLTNLTNEFTTKWREILKTRISPNYCVEETIKLMLSTPLSTLSSNTLL
jgi:hypothetical protein